MPATVALVCSLADRYGADLLRGACRVARGWGWRFRHISEVARRGSPFPWPVDGAIGYFSPHDSARLDALGLPHVPLNPERSLLLIDEAAVGACAARHLIGLGLPRLAAASAWYMDAGCHRRVEGFCAVAAQSGIPCEILPRRRLRPTALCHAIAGWLRRQPAPFGLFCANDRFALIAQKACEQAGIAIPEQAALVGADNDEVVCELAPVPLSSVAMPHEPLGAAAAQRLRNLLAGGQAGPGCRLEPSVVIARASSDVPAADPALARALSCIRERHAAPLGVAEVAAAAGLHRRALERRFRASLGRSVHDEIARVRMQMAQELLVDGRRPVTAVAALVGLSHSSFVEAFVRATGRSPGAWREARRE